MSTHDLRRIAQRMTDLRRRHAAHDTLSETETAELERGTPAEDMFEIVESIRGERRSATPAAKAKAKKEKAISEKAKSTPITDIKKFLEEEHDSP